MELTYKITSYDTETDVATIIITLNGETFTKRANGVPVTDPKECDEFMTNWATAYLSGLQKAKSVDTELLKDRSVGVKAEVVEEPVEEEVIS